MTSLSEEKRIDRLENRFDRFKEKGEESASNGSSEDAAYCFEKAADAAVELSELKDGVVGEKWGELAEEFREAAESQRHVTTGSSTAGDGEKNSGCARGGSGGDSDSAPGAGYTDAGADPEGSEYFTDPPSKSFEDVGGLNELKQILDEEVIHPLNNPEYYERQNTGVNNGVLLYGPPGTGKTHVSEALAGELGYSFASVRASDLSSKYVGESSKNIRGLFDEARSVEPCLVFIDEIDALASDRSTGNKKTNSERQAVNELLQEFQEIQGTDVLVVAATNKLEDLDSAIKRSGRFNTRYFVGPPGPSARKQILQVHLEDRETDLRGVDWRQLVKWTKGFSASDLWLVAEKAATISARRSTEQGALKPITHRMLLEAVKETEASLKDYSRSE